MHAVSDIIGELLILKQLATKVTPGAAMGQWPLFKGVMDDSPDNMVVITDVESVTAGRIHRTGETLGPWLYQVRTRAKTYRAAQEKSSEISSFFDLVLREEVTIDSSVYKIHAIHQSTRSAYMGADLNKRPSFVINGIITFR